jgi:choice-of-anchor C domain-containing protein
VRGAALNPRSALLGAFSIGTLLIPAAEPVPHAAPQSASLLVNGSFEQAPVTRTYLNLPGGSTSIVGWVVTGEGIDVVRATYWVASEGDNSIDLDGSRRSSLSPPYAQGGIAQRFATVAGTRYRVSFAMAGNMVPRPAVKSMRVSAAGQTMDFTFDVTGKTARSMGWLRKSWTFTAKADSTTLEFRSLTRSPLTGFGPAIDNVTVTPVERRDQLEVSEDANEILVRLGAELLFDTGKHMLRPAATAALQKLAILLKDHPGLPILIEGHTDSVGTPQANRLLSERRANAVREWLTSRGNVPAERMTSKGFGPAVPVASNATAEGRQQNRRVEIRVRKAEV